MNKYDEMFRYVREMLAEYDSHAGEAERKIKYSRFEHTRRVYHWMLKLYEALEDKQSVDIDSLKVAAIFHDIGYGSSGDEPHAEAGARICREYLEGQGYEQEQIDFICKLIAGHSDKKQMQSDIPVELVLLMEADLLDDTGAQGVVMDIWMEASEGNATFESIRDHIERYSVRLAEKNPMRTAKGKEIWAEKRRIVMEFFEAYCEDLDFSD